LVDAVVVAVETAAVISFRVFTPLELALGAKRCHLPSMFVEVRATGGPIVPVPAGGDAQ
jgi:hypothetical protein